jgi:hypothetical protein
VLHYEDATEYEIEKCRLAGAIDCISIGTDASYVSGLLRGLSEMGLLRARFDCSFY